MTAGVLFIQAAQFVVLNTVDHVRYVSQQNGRSIAVRDDDVVIIGAGE
jgi:hypothetical protein